MNIAGVQTFAYQKLLKEASTATLGLAAASSGLGQAMYPVFFAFYRSTPQVQFFAASIFATIGAVKQMISAFQELEQQQLRFQLSFAHAGLGSQTGQFASFARANQLRTGIGEGETLGLAAELANLRFNQTQIAQLIPALQGAELAGLGKPSQIASNIAKASVGGETQALVDLGLDVNKIRRSSDRASEIIRQVVEKFAQDTEIAMSTVGRQQQALGNDWKSLLAEMGDLLAPIFAGLLAVVRHFVIALRAIPLFLAEVARVLPGVGFIAQTQSSQTTEAIRRSGLNRERTNADNLRKIEQNTREIQTTLARATLGAAGAAVRDAATVRNFRLAVGVRG